MRRRWVAAAVAAGLSLPQAASGQKVEHGPSNAVYCHPDNFASDPPDVPRGGSARGALPGGLIERKVSVGGVRTSVVQGGDPAKPAVVIVPGNAGSGYDFAQLLAALAPRAHVISYDLPGYGHADKPRDFPYTLDAQTDYLEGLLDELGVRKGIIGGHDLGASYALEWIVRNPDRALGAFIASGGMAPDYRWHGTAEVWRTPDFGEAFMSVLNRPMWSFGVNQGQPEPLPPEFVDRMYDDLDRATRCAILDTYRRTSSPDATGRRQAAALAPHDIPALVVWGRHDAFIDAEYAERQKLGFPRAEVHVLEEAGHWPFVDAPDRTADLFGDFADRVLAPRAKLRIGARGWRAGARRARVRVSASPPARSVVVELSRRGRTLARSRTLPTVETARRIVLRPRVRLHAGRYRLRATAVNADPVSRVVRVRREVR